jgi:hypothetical protein
MVCIDPHRESLAELLFGHLCERGHRDRVLFGQREHHPILKALSSACLVNLDPVKEQVRR